MEYQKYQFDFERLDVYQKALNFTDRIFNITMSFRREIQYSLGDQFRRAALSICNNLAEGSRKAGKGKRQFYNFAFDSARECIPMISLSIKQKQIDNSTEAELRNECVQICNMIYKLRQSVT
ncbi:MAG: hypothetical protein A2Z88_03910 [Omnitrophica WOR_2 bacterium GWA2_47_8]|nr:MAG: hypothetical protein A2Z88_03910 [Omnitrophica WOR_2 bacterium GWA2_47_8]